MINLCHMQLMLLILGAPALTALDGAKVRGPAVGVAHAAVGAGLGGWRHGSFDEEGQVSHDY
jgi:hypothetical protein